MKQQSALAALTRGQVFGEDLGFTVQRLTGTSARVLGVERVSLWRYTEGRTAIRCVDLYESSRRCHSAGAELEAARYPSYFEALATSEAVVVDDARSDPRTSGFLESYLVPHGITAMMDIPVFLHGRLEGVLCHEQVGPASPWRPEDRLFGIAIANLIALAIEHAERRLSDAALKESEGRFRLLADTVPVMVWIAGSDGKGTYFNRSWLEFTGRGLAEEIGSCWADLIHPDDRDRCLGVYGVAMKARRPFTVEYRYRRRDGEYRWLLDTAVPRPVADGGPGGFIGACTDITDRKTAEARIERLAYHDGLTGLPNRTLFMDRLAQGLRQAERHGRELVLLYLDLDRFKTINDTLGHMVGDELLRQAGRRLEALLRGEDTVARLGGDEFVILLPGLGTAQDAAHVASKAAAVLAAPFSIGAHLLHVTASIGISVYPRDGADTAQLLKHADVALYQAKERGRNSYVFFGHEMTRAADQRLELENRLRRALERDELCLYYQPQARLADLSITGVEALLRWQHPERGLLTPGEFIDIAEDTGLIVPIGEWVLRTACAQAREWQRSGLPPFRLGVNLSPRQFGHEDLCGMVKAILRETGLNATWLELELTESGVAHDPERAVAMLAQLRALGVQLALDDFGTGYSSLAYLKRFPLHRLKVDRSFVRDIPGDADDVAIVEAILAMARRLKLAVVAEGVESEAQRAFLRAHGCQEMQGYALSPPLAPGEVPALLQNMRAETVAS